VPRFRLSLLSLDPFGAGGAPFPVLQAPRTAGGRRLHAVYPPAVRGACLLTVIHHVPHRRPERFLRIQDPFAPVLRPPPPSRATVGQRIQRPRSADFQNAHDLPRGGIGCRDHNMNVVRPHRQPLHAPSLFRTNSPDGAVHSRSHPRVQKSRGFLHQPARVTFKRRLRRFDDLPVPWMAVHPSPRVPRQPGPVRRPRQEVRERLAHPSNPAIPFYDFTSPRHCRGMPLYAVFVFPPAPRGDAVSRFTSPRHCRGMPLYAVFVPPHRRGMLGDRRSAL